MDTSWVNHAEAQIMTESAACQNCDAELPPGASYCPGCGTPTPTGISGDSRTTSTYDRDDPRALAYRERLQQALAPHFELLHELGRGGFAEVHAALDSRLRRHVAVKTLRYDLAGLVSPELLDRFQREAEAMAQLSHPNIMPIYTVGEGEGIVYFIMPLARGDTLSRKLRGSQGLPIGEARRITLEIAQALDHAHHAGVVHRDVKPDNILLEGDEERVIVTDFGIAKAAAASAADLTGTGIAIGTPAYMSPEQATGEPDIDHRADLYSLGVVSFQMLTGQLPFSAPTAVGLIAKQATEDAPKVASLRANCPRVFAEVVDRCLAKERSERFESAAELRATLETRMSGGSAQPVASQLSREEKPPRPVYNPFRVFRLSVLISVVGVLAAVPVDLLTNRSVDFSPIVLVGCILLVASQYSRLWMAGYSWREALSYSGPTGSEPSASTGQGGQASWSSLSPLQFSETLMHTARAERAIIVRLLNQVAQKEQRHIASVLPALDEVLAKMVVTVERSGSIEKAIADRQRAVESSSSGSRHKSPDERAIQKLIGDRAAAAESLEMRLSAIQELRGAVESAVQVGVAGSAGRISDAVNHLSRGEPITS